MQIFIARGKEQHGPYPLEQAKDLLAKGVLKPGDYAYHEGLSDWTPLSEVIAALSAPAAPPANVASPSPVAGPSHTATAKPKSNAPLVIAIVAGLMVLGGLAAAGGWYFFLRDEPMEFVKTPPSEVNEPPNKEVEKILARGIGTWKITGHRLPVIDPETGGPGKAEDIRDTIETRWKEKGKSTVSNFSPVINGKKVSFVGYKEYDAKAGVFIWRVKGEGLPEAVSKERYDPVTKTFHGEVNYQNNTRELSTFRRINKDRFHFKSKAFDADNKLLGTAEVLFTRLEKKEPNQPPMTAGSLTAKEAAEVMAWVIGKWETKGKGMPVGGEPQAIEMTMEARWKEEGKSVEFKYTMEEGGKTVNYFGHQQYDEAKGIFIYRSKWGDNPETTSHERYDPATRTSRGQSAPASPAVGSKTTTVTKRIGADKTQQRLEVREGDRLVYSHDILSTRVGGNNEPAKPDSNSAEYTILGTLTDNFDRRKVVSNVEDTLAKHPDVDAMVGLFAYNPPVILQVLKKAGKLGKVKVVAFDEDDATLQGIKDGTVQSTVAQNPFMYGYKSIEVLNELKKGNDKVIPKDGLIDVPARAIRKKDVDKFWAVLKKHRLGGQPVAQQEGRPIFAFVSNGVAPFWDIAKAGVLKAASDLEVNVEVHLPAAGVQDQNRILQTLVAQGVDGIAVSPIDPANQKTLLQEIAKKTILITQDNDAPDSNRRAYIGMKNYDAGRLCGKLVKEALPKGGKVMLFIGRLEQENAKKRQQGLIDELNNVETSTSKPTEPEPAPHAPEKGLVAYYPFNGNAKDEAGNGHDGTVVGAKLTADRHGKPNSAYQFKLGNHIKIDGLMGKPKNVTLAAWVKLEGPQGRLGSEIISLGVSASIRVDSKSYSSQRVGTGGITRMQPKAWMNTLAKFNYTGTGWHQIVFTFDDDADKQVTYVDGVQLALKENEKSIVYEGNDKDTVIGIHGRGQTDWRSQGVIDDIRIYDRALSAREVKTLFLKEKPAGKLQAGKVIKITPIAELRAQALAGDLRAQFQMGLKAINGADGLKRNPLMAEKWWLRAAKQGHGFAQMNLGVIYSRGDLGEKDLAKAYRWVKLSLMRGNQRAQQLVDKLEKELNPQQIAEADAFVKAFKPVPENPGGAPGANAPKTRAAVIRAGLPNYPVLTPNTDPKKIKFDTVNLNRTSVKYQEAWYDGFRFTVPKEGGELAWAFKGSIKSWYIMPLKGRMEGFRSYNRYNLKRDIPPMGKTGDKVILQTLPAENLKAGEEYVIWFSFTKQVPVPVYISLNIFAGNSPGTKAIAEALDKAANLVKEPVEKKEEISAEDIADGKLELIQAKLKAGANPDFFIYPKRKGTVLHAAVSKGTIEVVKLILAGGAKPNPLNWLGKTPLDRLHESNEKKEPAERMAPEAFAAMETLLQKHGAKRSAQPNEGEPAAPEPEPAKPEPAKPEPAAKAKKPGTVLWEFETGGSVSSSPAIGSDGTVYVGSQDNKLYALSGKSGVKLWEFETGDDVTSSPAIGSDGTVYVGSIDKKLYAINGKSGVKLWEFETGDFVNSSPAIGSDGTVYFGSIDKKLYAINGKSGVKLWEFETGGWVESSPAIGSDGTVYVGSNDKTLYAINGKSGVKLWEFETGGWVQSSPAIGSDGTVYVGGDSRLYAINGKSGVKLWEFETGGYVKSSPTIGPDGTVYVGSFDNNLYAINGKSGIKLWEFETGDDVFSPPAIGSDGTVYFGSQDKTFYAINGKSGVKLWEFETGSGVYCSSAIGSDGTVYIGSVDRKLYAIKTDSKGLAKSPWPMRGQNAQHTGRAAGTAAAPVAKPEPAKPEPAKPEPAAPAKKF